MEFMHGTTNIQQGLFLMAAGVGFVFLVQLVFFSVVKLWPHGKKDSE